MFGISMHGSGFHGDLSLGPKQEHWYLVTMVLCTEYLSYFAGKPINIADYTLCHWLEGSVYLPVWIKKVLMVKNVLFISLESKHF